jgi:hypothetical protein
MLTAADRAATLAALIAAAMSSDIDIDCAASSGAVTVRAHVPDGTDPLAWGRI